MSLIIGSHVSFTSNTGLLGSVNEALSYGANTFMIYTGNQNNTIRFDIKKDFTKAAVELMNKNNIDKKNIVAHAPFILNLSNNLDARKYNFYIYFLKQEIKRCKELGIENLVIHPGSKVTLSTEEAINNLATGINLVLKDIDNINLLIEFMSGKGSEIGSIVDEIKKIIDLIEKKDQIFVCLDTCHINDSGIDLTKFDDFLDEFDKKIGIEKIKCIHINDSYNEIGTKKDRHANFGYGTIGFNTLINVVYNKRLENIPKILETPLINKKLNDSYPPYKYEIESIKNKKFIDFINQ